MCGRYVIFTDEEKREMNHIMNEINKKYNGEDVRTGEIFPTNKAPILLSENNQITSDLIAWGFPNFKNKGVIINSRAETAEEKRMFRDSLFLRRCVIPSTGFYEWKHDTTKQKYLFQLPNEQMLYMAGFYNEFQGEKRFIILTTAANASMAEVHDRMPVVLQKDMLKSWIDNTTAAMEILHEVPPMLEKMAI